MDHRRFLTALSLCGALACGSGEDSTNPDPSPGGAGATSVAGSATAGGSAAAGGAGGSSAPMGGASANGGSSAGLGGGGSGGANVGGAGGASGGDGSGGGAGSSGGAGGSGGGAWNEGTELKAFPTAEGYGRKSVGGRGGRVIKVTNLNDSGAGSLRAAIETTGARTVVFDVGGVINLKSKLVIKKEHAKLTIAGQTAPGKGVVVHGWTFGLIGGSDVIMRFIRTRVGTSSGETMDGMGITGADANNVIYDHNSISWTIDEAFSSRGASNFTLQRTLISEALNEAGTRTIRPALSTVTLRASVAILARFITT